MATAQTATSRTSRAPRKRSEVIDGNCPPLFVKHIPTGMVTAWSSIFKRRLTEFAPHFRPNTDDEFSYETRRRNHAAKMAGRRGESLDASPFGGDEFDGENDL
jgi:hypothetical protein